mgnify:CR=1 FL=1
MIHRRTTRRVREKIFPSLAVVAVVTVVTVVAVARATSACVFSTVHPTPSTSSIPPSAHATRTRPARSRSRARARDRSVAFSTSDMRRYFFYPPPATLRARAGRAPGARDIARDIRARVSEINFLESPLVVSPPGVEVRCRHHLRLGTARPGDGFVYVYRSKVSHPSENTTLAPGNNARHPRARRKYDTAAIGDETNGHSERPTARTRARWMDGRTRRARARRATSDRATRGVDRAARIFSSSSPPRRVVARGDGRRSTPASPADRSHRFSIARPARVSHVDASR